MYIGDVMIIKNLFFTLLLVCSLNINAAVGSGGKAVIDLITAPKTFGDLLDQKGIYKNESVAQLKTSVEYSLSVLSDSGKGSIEDLKALKSRLKGKSDNDMYDSMMSVLERKDGEVTAKELVTAINTMSRLSRKYAKQASFDPNRTVSFGTCASCVNEELSELGLDFVIIEKKDMSKGFRKDIKANMRNKRTMIKTIQQRLGSKGYGSFKRGDFSDEQLESLLYLSFIDKHGSALEKELADRIKRVSQVSPGKYDIFDSANGHSFFNLPITARTERDKRMWIELLDETIAEMEANNKNTMDAFYSILQRRVDNEADAGKKADKQSYLDYLRKHKCFENK